MEVKIDTREKFHVITLPQEFAAANMTESLNDLINPLLESHIRNVILKMQQVHSIDNASAENLALLQQRFYENNASFVICELTRTAEAELEKYDLLEVMNVTPTESEAWDIVHMEEIERELMDDESGQPS
jgi:anti-anti-sigma factor